MEHVFCYIKKHVINGTTEHVHGWPWLAELGTVHRVIDKGKPGKREEVSNFFLTDLAGDMTKI